MNNLGFTIAALRYVRHLSPLLYEQRIKGRLRAFVAEAEAPLLEFLDSEMEMIGTVPQIAHIVWAVAELVKKHESFPSEGIDFPHSDAEKLSYIESYGLMSFVSLLHRGFWEICLSEFGCPRDGTCYGVTKQWAFVKVSISSETRRKVHSRLGSIAELLRLATCMRVLAREIRRS